MSNIYKWNEPTETKKVIQLKSIHNTNEDFEKDVKVKPDFEQLKQQAQNEVEKARSEAQKIIEEANQQAELIHNEAQNEREKVLEESKKSGYSTGYEEGQKKATQEYEQLIVNAQQMLNQTKLEYQSTTEKAEQDILLIAVKSAEKILRRQLYNEPSYFIDLVKTTITEVLEQSDITIKVHPNDFGIVHEYKEDIQQMFPSQTSLTIYPDQSLTEGSCIVESPFGIIDASIDTQLNQLKDQLMSYFKGVE